MYKATITNKVLSNGMLTVYVTFESDTHDTFDDKFETNQPQKDGWIEKQIQRKLAILNALPATADAVEKGKVVTLSEPTSEILPPSIVDAKAQYKIDLDQFNKFVAALAKGFTDQQNNDFIALKKKLTDNFQTEYLDLF